MVVLEQCRVDDGKVIIEAAIEDYSQYKDVYIQSISIDTENTYTDNDCVSSNAVFTQTYENKKRVRLCLSVKDFTGIDSLDNHIFFVYVQATGTPKLSLDSPCGCDKDCIVGVAINLQPLYNLCMGYMKELESDCDIPRGFIDSILRLKALELSLDTGNFPMAIKYWKTLFKNKSGTVYSKNCGCNGIG